MEKVLLLYDGHCLLCNRLIRALLQSDRNDRLVVASLQDYTVLSEGDPSLPKIDGDIDSVVLIKNDHIYYKSDAVLHVKAIVSVIPIFYKIGLLIPRVIRDVCYDWVAGRRYKWFGYSDECLLPDPAYRHKYVMRMEELHALLGSASQTKHEP